MSANDTQVAGDHYQTDYQHWDMTYRYSYDTYQYIISKYVVRWKRKNGVEDLKKARHAMNKYLEVVAKRRKDCVALPIKPKHDALDVIKFCYANDLDTYQASVISHITGWEHYQDQDFLGSASKILDEYIAVTEKEQYLDDIKAAEEAQCSPPPIPKDLTDLWEATRLAEEVQVSVSGVPYKVAVKDLKKSSITPVITITVEDERGAEMFDGDTILKIIKENSEEIKEQILRGKVRAREEAWRGEKPQE